MQRALNAPPIRQERVMIRLARSAMAALVLFSSAAALAEPGATPTEKTTCRQFVETGRITPKRVCLTRTQWAEVRKAMAERHAPLIAFTPIQLERGL
jgi:hypothetical protein